MLPSTASTKSIRVTLALHTLVGAAAAAPGASARAGEEASDPPARAGAAATAGAGVRYYAAYEEGTLCSHKPTAEFESWEEAYASREECCAVSFSWDYEACVADETDRVPPPRDESAGGEGGDASIPRHAGALEAEAGFELPAEA